MYHKTCISIYRAHIFNVPGACARESPPRAATTKKKANAFHTDSIFMFIFLRQKIPVFDYLEETMDYTCYIDIHRVKMYRLHLCRRLVNAS